MRFTASVLPSRHTGYYTIVELPDEIDVSNADGVREQLLGLLNAGGSTAGPLIVDLTRTTFCDSSAINALVRAHNRAAALGRQVYAAVSLEGIARKVFDITALPRLIPTYDDVESAIATAVAAIPDGGKIVGPSRGGLDRGR